MKTNEEILAYYQSEESNDAIGAQRLALLCLLPFDMAKVFLVPTYVQAHEAGSLAEDEFWVGDESDAEKNLLTLMPELYKVLQNKETIDASFFVEGMLHLKALIWVLDEPFHNEISPLFVGDPFTVGKTILDSVSSKFGYQPTIQDVDYEEVPEESQKEEK